MKAATFILFFVVLSCTLCVFASAQTYMDDMDDANANHIKQYSGLSPYTYGRGAATMPDPTVFVFSNTAQPYGWTQYRVQGATEVVAAIYTHAGTFVSQMPDDSSIYLMGVTPDNANFLNSRSFQQALYSSSSNAIYTQSSGLKQVYHTGSYYLFGPVLTPPAGELIGYGVNIYHSMDGRSFTRANAVHTKLDYDPIQVYFYEEYSASVPSSAKYIRVAINDVTSVPLTTGGYQNKAQKLFTSLASVIISGENLIPGGPESTVENPFPPPPAKAGDTAADDEAEEISQEQKENNGLLPSKTLPEILQPNGQNSKSSSASSKFEGTITSSSKTSSAYSSEKTNQGGEESEPENSLSAEQSEIPREEAIIYEISRGENDNRFNGAIIVYIIIVTGAIVLVVILPKK